MILHKYDEDTKEYLGEVVAFQDPIKSERLGYDVFAFPPFSTDVELPVCEEGYSLIFSEENKVWEKVKDYRGKVVYNKRTGEELTISTLGDISSDYSFEKPLTLNELRDIKFKEVKEKFNEALEKIIKVGKIEKSANDWSLLSKCAYVPINFKKIPIFLENDTVFVTEEELEEAVKYLYIRCMLLTIRNKEIRENIASVRSKKQLIDVKVDFNVDKEIEDYMKLSVDELNEKFSEVVE